MISGAIHYFRVHPEQWRTVRRRVAMGCNTVETYVAWNIHQPSREVTTFEGFADLGRFLDIAAEEGLDAIVRPGPYICAEWENGGFPGWILADRNLRLRNRNAPYLALVDAWFDQLIPVVAERQATRGGNVVMVQVENEYGSFGDDKVYLAHLRDGLIERGIGELLVTSDGPARRWLTGGTVDGALATVNFGSRTLEVLAMTEEELPAQPQMCMEFWNGWFDHWGEEHHERTGGDAAGELKDMLEHGMSVNFYMAHGGTNFGLRAGANHFGALQPTTTSYDYDAPIAENGALTEKFRAFRDVIAKHTELPELEEHLEQLRLDAQPATLSAGEVTIEKSPPCAHRALHPRAEEHPLPALLRGHRPRARPAAPPARSRSRPGGRRREPIQPLRLYDLHDGPGCTSTGSTSARPAWSATRRARPTRPRSSSPSRGPLLPEGGLRTVRVDILVENLGRVNFGPRLGERKGILGGVWQTVRFLNDWEADAWPLEEMGEELAALLAAAPALDTPATADEAAAGGADALPVLVSASFEADSAEDAFLDVSDAGHGVAYVNGFCVGRYWNIGPQLSLYVPAPLVHEGRNEVLLLDLEKRPTRLALATEHLFGRTDR